MRYLNSEKAASLVRKINEAKTPHEHREAQVFCDGFKTAIEYLGLTWPCIALDLEFEDGDRPTCCGEYLDWKQSNDNV